jgi:hypothetical protein
MTQEYISKMAKDLIRMCDAVEKHGLVDYQYGVAEERIMMSESQNSQIETRFLAKYALQFLQSVSTFKNQ